MGTAGYMSPEAGGRKAARCPDDLFSFGLVLRENGGGAHASWADPCRRCLEKRPRSLKATSTRRKFARPPALEREQTDFGPGDRETLEGGLFPLPAAVLAPCPSQATSISTRTYQRQQNSRTRQDVLAISRIRPAILCLTAPCDRGSAIQLEQCRLS